MQPIPSPLDGFASPFGPAREWWPLGASFALEVQNSRYMASDTTYPAFLSIPNTSAVVSSNWTYEDVSGLTQTAAANQPLLDWRTGQSMMYAWPTRTNYFLNSDSPATQTVNLSIGEHVLFMKGTGSVAASANNGTATGLGTATDGEANDVVFDVTIAGTFDFTVSGGPTWVDVQAGEARTAHIPTTGTAVTAPAITYSVTSLDTASWYNAGAGTMLVKFYLPLETSAEERVILDLNQNPADTNNRIALSLRAADFDDFSLAGTKTAGVRAYSPFDTGDPNLGANAVAMAWDTNDWTFFHGGVEITTGNTTSPAASIVDLFIACGFGGANQLDGGIESLTYFPQREANARLQTLTS